MDRARRAFQDAAFADAVALGRQAAAAGGGAAAHLLVGNALFKLNRMDEAEREYSDALRLDPANKVVQERLEMAREARAKATP